MIAKATTKMIDRDIADMLRGAKTRPLRLMRDFAESEFRIPEGKYQGERLRLDRQPVQAIFLDEIDSGKWQEIYVAGPSQSGKTLIAFNVPILYFSAELQEAIVIGTPDGNMATDKWVKEIRPTFEASTKLRRLLPVVGPGSKKGKVRDYIELSNGVFLRFMGRGGDDTAKAGYTARVVIATEAAGWSTGTETSQEADPIEQLKARQMSYDDDRILIVEGTVTVPEELPWSAKDFTSQSRLLSPCPHCGEWISPERDDLLGWDDAKNEMEARERARWGCRECGELIDDEQRRWSVQQCKIVHGSQKITSTGEIVGELPPTRKLWFRWSAWHNLNVSTATLGAEEWQCHQIEEDTPARDSAEKRQCQFRFATPFVAKLDEEQLQLSANHVASKSAEYPRGLIPDECTHLAVGIDGGKYLCYYTVICGLPGGRMHVPLYGSFDVHSDRMDPQVALYNAILEFWDSTILPGFTWQNHKDVIVPGEVFIDAGDGNFTSSVFRAWRKLSGGRRKSGILPIFGRGSGQMQKMYAAPKKVGKGASEIGDNWHVARVSAGKKDRGWGAFIDVDIWKDRIQNSLALDSTLPGSITLYSGPSREHQKFGKHITNEHKEIEFVPGRGRVVKWVRTGQQAWLDSTCYARVALERLGYRVDKADNATARE